MKILFIHQNMPGQFKHLAPALARDEANEVVFLTRRADVMLPDVRRITYAPSRSSGPETHHYLRDYEDGVLHGQQVGRVCRALARGGFHPDIVVAHPGWGEALFVKDVFPRTPLLSYCEFYYRGAGSDIGFDPDMRADLDTVCRARARNAHLLLSLEACDHGISPTEWQKYQHPAPLQPKISVVFDGVDTAMVRPDPAARVTLPNGRVVTRNDSVVTYVARNLEPYRGFPTFMRAVPDILRRRPDAHVLIVGGDEVSYGKRPASHPNWRECLMQEVGASLDMSHVHFLGTLPYRQYLSVLQVSSAHVYLTVPFVLSWSCVEAMAAGCAIVGSATRPVQEIIEDGRNGYLVDFFSPSSVAERVADVLRNDAGTAAVRSRARTTVLERYDLAHCLREQLRLISRMAGSSGPGALAGFPRSFNPDCCTDRPVRWLARAGVG